MFAKKKALGGMSLNGPARRTMWCGIILDIKDVQDFIRVPRACLWGVPFSAIAVIFNLFLSPRLATAASAASVPLDVLVERGDQQTFRELSRKVKDSPSDIQSWGLLVKLIEHYPGIDDIIELSGALKAIIRRSPENPFYYYFLGRILRRSLFIFDAADAYDKASRLDMQGLMLYDKPLETLLQQGQQQLKEVTNRIKKEAGELVYSSEIFNRLQSLSGGARQGTLSGPEDYLWLCMYVVRLSPNDPSMAIAYLGMAGVFSYLGSLNLPVDYCLKAIQLQPESDEGYRALASHLCFAKKALGAIKWSEARKRAIGLLKDAPKVERLRRAEEGLDAACAYKQEAT
jgi:tetratricopeptide (TPR) repeat protein